MLVGNECTEVEAEVAKKMAQQNNGDARVTVYNANRNGLSILRLLRPDVEIYTCRRLPYSWAGHSCR